MTVKLRKAKEMTKWEGVYLHVAVNDLPLEFFAVLSGEIPCTIGSTKGAIVR
jgi:hypothetical protein